MLILALETSTQKGSVALFRDEQRLSYRESATQKSHSELLNQMIAEVLVEGNDTKLSEIDFFAVGQGPGSFTGLRIAGNIGKTFSYLHNKPLISVDSLTLLAMAAQDHQDNPTVFDLSIISMINAYKNMVYLAQYPSIRSLYKDSLTQTKSSESYFLPPPTIPPRVVRIQDLEEIITEPCLVIGDGFNAYSSFFSQSLKANIHRSNLISDFPEANYLGRAALLKSRIGQTLNWNSFLPLYLRASEAEENLKGIIFKPLKS